MDLPKSLRAAANRAGTAVLPSVECCTVCGHALEQRGVLGDELCSNCREVDMAADDDWSAIWLRVRKEIPDDGADDDVPPLDSL
jgi:hypothetical protein